ncbi:MAG: 30S ribosome-binding factor RbfA [Dehalococcoidia bacterium]
MRRRTQRVNELLRHELSWLLATEMNDPRLPTLVTITHVEVTADLRFARVFVSFMGTDEEKKSAMEMLNAATGFLRRGLKPKLTLRHVPGLSFQLDESIEKGTRLLQILDGISPPSEPSP